MRWALLAAVGVVGCQTVPNATPPRGLGGGVIPPSYALRAAESGYGPAVLSRPLRTTIQRTAHVTQPLILPRPVLEVSPGYSADYRWIVGYLSQERGNWHIRYGSERVDSHGGRLQLLDLGPTQGFVTGQLVRVEGDLVDPAPYEIRPAYRVRLLTVVGRQDR